MENKNHPFKIYQYRGVNLKNMVCILNSKYANRKLNYHEEKNSFSTFLFMYLNLFKFIFQFI